MITESCVLQKLNVRKESIQVDDNRQLKWKVDKWMRRKRSRAGVTVIDKKTGYWI